MKRELQSLNNMSFILPKGWNVTEDKYNLTNGQGFVNIENYLSNNGKVISLFAVYRQPAEFFDVYQELVENYDEKLDGMVLERELTLKFNGFAFPVYILRGTKQPTIYMVQIFVNCADRLACFMFSLDNYSEDNKELIANNQTFVAMTQILRTIE